MPITRSASPSAAESRDVLRRLNRGVRVRERRMHDFVTSFAVVHSGNFVIAERQSVDDERTEGLIFDIPALVDAAPSVFWLEDPARPEPLPSLRGASRPPSAG